jgi:uncharacterized protein DUF4238
LSEPHVHHYVPQFYQRGFSLSEDRNKVWVYERGIRPRRRSVRSTGMELDLYAFPGPDGATDFASVEKALARLDDDAAKIVHRIEKHERLTLKDRSLLSRFASVMYRRTPKHKAKVNKMAIDLLPKVLEPLQAISDQLNEAGRAEIERIRGEYSANPPTFLFAQHVLRESEFENLMYTMDWVFFEAEQCSAFLTSDDPVMFSTGSGLGSPDAVIGFPLSKKLFLQCMWKSSYHTAFCTLSSERVNYFNECTIKSAYKQVYASDKVEDIQLAVDRNLGVWG